jgi:hypothetical protein
VAEVMHLGSPMWNIKGSFRASRCNEITMDLTDDPALCTCPKCQDDFSSDVAFRHFGYDGP